MISKEEATKSALEFLTLHQAGTLATASLSGRPFSSTIYFAFLPDFTLYFTTSHHSAKFRNIVLNNKVSFSVGTGPEYRELVIHGHATILDDADEKEEALAAIKKRVTAPPEAWPVHAVKSLSDGGTALLRINPEEIIYLDLPSKDQMEASAKYFYRLLP